MIKIRFLRYGAVRKGQGISEPLSIFYLVLSQYLHPVCGSFGPGFFGGQPAA